MVDEVFALDEGDNGQVDRSGVVEPIRQLGVQLRVSDPGADSHTSLDRVLDLVHHILHVPGHILD